MSTPFTMFRFAREFPLANMKVETMDFDHCLNFTLGIEKGLANLKNDHGGLTNFGVTQKTYDSYRFHKGLPARSVADITLPEVRDLYDIMYWRPSGAVCCPDTPLAQCLFDYAVNSGVVQAVRSAQRCFGLSVDGIVGPQTAARFASATEEDAKLYLAARLAFVTAIAKKDPTQAGFLASWKNRINLLQGGLA